MPAVKEFEEEVHEHPTPPLGPRDDKETVISEGSEPKAARIRPS